MRTHTHTQTHTYPHAHIYSSVCEDSVLYGVQIHAHTPALTIAPRHVCVEATTSSFRISTRSVRTVGIWLTPDIPSKKGKEKRGKKKRRLGWYIVFPILFFTNRVRYYYGFSFCASKSAVSFFSFWFVVVVVVVHMRLLVFLPPSLPLLLLLLFFSSTTFHPFINCGL